MATSRGCIARCKWRATSRPAEENRTPSVVLTVAAAGPPTKKPDFVGLPTFTEGLVVR